MEARMKKVYLLIVLTGLCFSLMASFPINSENNINVHAVRDLNAPYNLIAQVISDNEVLLVWENPVYASLPMGFRIYSNMMALDEVGGPNVTDCIVDNICAGCHQFYVTAYFDNGSETLPSNIVEVTLTSNQDYAAPAASISLNAYPNPSRSSVNITLKGVEQKETGTLGIYNLKGQLIRQYSPKGATSWQWDGRDKQGRNVSNGTYYLRVSTNKGSLVQKVKIVR
jgi:hypothetical protein